MRLKILCLVFMCCMTAHAVNVCLRLSTNGDNLTALRSEKILQLYLAIQRQIKECSIRRLRVNLWPYFGEESECGGGRGSSALITKYFYFVMNMFFGPFSTPSRCCWPSLAIQRWGKELSTMHQRVRLWSFLGIGCCLQYFDPKSFYFILNMVFGSF